MKYPVPLTISRRVTLAHGPRSCDAEVMSTTDTAPDRSSDTPPRTWSTRLAAFKGRGASERDPRVQRCRQALSYWRARRVIDAELATLTDDDRADLAQRLTT